MSEKTSSAVELINQAYAVSEEKCSKGVKRELRRLAGGWALLRRYPNSDFYSKSEKKMMQNQARLDELKAAGRLDENRALDRRLLAEALADTVVIGMGVNDLTLTSAEIVDVLCSDELDDLRLEVIQLAGDFDTYRKYQRSDEKNS